MGCPSPRQLMTQESSQRRQAPSRVISWIFHLWLKHDAACIFRTWFMLDRETEAPYFYSSGMPVLKEGTAAVIEALQQKGCLLKEERYAHKYPYDWRTKLPTIFRATDQVN